MTAGDEALNLQVLEASRTPPKPGDVFEMKLVDGRHLVGRVVSVDASIGPMENVILIYIYGPPTATTPAPAQQELSLRNLLLPPMMTNRLPWLRGYFRTIAHRPLSDSELLARHSFYSANRDRYFDEKSNELPGPTELVGEWGLHSYRTIDDAVSDAVGIERALSVDPATDR